MTTNLLGLTDPGLFKTKGFIGEWCSSSTGNSYEVVNPATAEVLATLPDMGADEALKAVQQAKDTFPQWSSLTVDERSQILKKWAQLIREHKDDLGRIMTLEQGKTLAESVGEIVYSASYLDWYAEEVARPSGRIIPAHNKSQRLMVSTEPLGVGAIITPWNFPSLMVMREVAPALASGCTIVVKPSGFTPLTPLALLELAIRAGLPPGTMSVIMGARGSGSSMGSVFTLNPDVRKISFTGSTTTGIQLAQQAASTVTRMSLELGGNAPFIVFDDADLDAALEGLIASKFRNAGQTCVTTNRIFVQDSIYEKFIDRFAERASQLKVGNGLDKGTQMGPMISTGAVEEVERHIEDAVKKGARILTGGKRHDLGHSFFEPTVLADVTPDMMPFQCEIFGPLAPICKFSSEEEAIDLANRTIHGLAAYFYSNGRERCWRVAEALQAGVVCENTVAFSSARAPFGGYKQSGMGRDGGYEGLTEWLETKYRCMGGFK
jgi:succinate-semialdehyde dehydrogenase/glutarate-semialdehyde dehydrogenase